MRYDFDSLEQLLSSIGIKIEKAEIRAIKKKLKQYESVVIKVNEPLKEYNLPFHCILIRCNKKRYSFYSNIPLLSAILAIDSDYDSPTCLLQYGLKRRFPQYLEKEYEEYLKKGKVEDRKNAERRLIGRIRNLLSYLQEIGVLVITEKGYEINRDRILEF
jgi:hypothetical protein